MNTFAHLYQVTTEEAEAEAARIRPDGDYVLECLGASPDGRGTWIVDWTPKVNQVTDEMRARRRELERNIQNARVHAIEDVYPDSGTYDPDDPRIDAREQELLAKWEPEYDKLMDTIRFLSSV